MRAANILTLLGFDYGTKHIGVAVGQVQTGTASPVASLRARGGKPDWIALSALVNRWQPDALVVGIPCHMDGREHAVTRAAKRFRHQLEERYNLPIFTVDERLTSIEAESRIAERRQRTGEKPRATVDAIAAQIILETWLNERRGA